MTDRILGGLVVLCLAMLPGCLALPIPNRSVDGYAVESQVVDAETHAPIPHAEVHDASDPTRTATSDAAGRFRLACVYQWHGGFLFGPISYPIWPFTTDITAPIREFKVVAAGYEEQVFVAAPEGWGNATDQSRTFVGATSIDEGTSTLKVPEFPMRKSDGRTRRVRYVNCTPAIPGDLG